MARGRAAGSTQRLRIIGGAWRSRQVTFPDLPGLRPTTDRVRETLFNWLAPVIAGSRCLDLFAGSGALGLEALSRGAAEVVFVDSHRKVCIALEENLARLGSKAGRTEMSEAVTFLRGSGGAFDIVFLDPPFREGLLAPSLSLLAERGWLAPGARVYMESEAEAGEPVLPAGWSLLRAKRAGQVGYYLAQTA